MDSFHSQQADESLDFEEQILEAAKSIAAATSALVKSASAAQRELVAQGKVSLGTGEGGAVLRCRGLSGDCAVFLFPGGLHPC